MEVLFDVDILFKNYAAERGIALSRPESLNDSPLFARAVAALVRQTAGGSPVRGTELFI